MDTSQILWAKERRGGLYYYEMGASTRPSQVIFDRATILKGVRTFHISGITPALSTSCAEASKEAVAAAKSAGCVVSLDINYRARLWSKETARECITGLLQDVTILFTTLDEASAVLGLEGGAEEVAREIAARWKVPVVAITLREAPSVLRNIWRSLALAEGNVYTGGPSIWSLSSGWVPEIRMMQASFTAISPATSSRPWAMVTHWRPLNIPYPETIPG